MVPAIAFACWFAALPTREPFSTVLDDVPVDSTRDDAIVEERVKPKLITPAMVAAAEAFIDLPMGSERYARVDGKRYVFVLEQHYHPPGYVGGPSGYHKGVTMYELR
jgi:hypothetical protein